ncbi:XTP/dITP diphosphatase [uncultured Veillonella sp.]|uniref:XTP/dITP diphosphatase n=1 Tax=uncultured Veillonella sp. TaxID=159268 RepID=UPI0025D856B5|nr:XTP/dITP diphosphatase [uncultured Veillonella sp.]MDY3973071.1 XTP/dITP diphosphatase [Veillonella caviae]
MSRLVVATHNKGKIREFKAAFEALGLDVVGVGELVNVPEPVEDGETFLDNARIKANYYMKATGLPCLADDSGLAVDVLGGEPGVHSARYAGDACDDEANNRKLIENLQAIPFEERTAHYVCELALVYPDGREFTARGTCSGLIQDKPVGDGGFGYDPYFYLPDVKQTMAQISLEEKNKRSHRGLALKELLAKMK